MEKRQFQFSKLLSGCASALAAFLLCVLFLFYLYGIFLNAVGEYGTRSREHTRALVLRADAEVLFIENTARILQSDAVTRSDVSRLDNLVELPVRTSSGVEGVNERGKGVVLWGQKIVPRETQYEFFRQVKMLSNMEGVFEQEKYKNRRLLLVSAEDTLLFSPFDTVEDWKGDSRQNSIELADYIESARAPLFQGKLDLTNNAEGNKGTAWTTAHPRAADGVQVITCYAPIYDLRGRLVSYLMGEVPISELEGREWLQKNSMSLVLFDSTEKPIFMDAALEGTRALRPHELSAKSTSAMNFELDGTWLLIFVNVPSTQWRVVYGVPLSKVFLTQWKIIFFSLCVLVSGVACIVWIARSARRRTHVPAQLSSREMVESRHLIQVIMDCSVVGLCLLRRSDGKILIQNEQSRKLIAMEVERDGRLWGLREYFLMKPDKETTEAGLLEIDAQTPDTASPVRVLAHLVEVNYHDEPALFCSFGDDNERRNAELRQASVAEAADEANAAKSKFLAMMSHEIRTPLYGVLGTLELLANTALLPQQRGYLSTIEQSSSNLLIIIDDILDFSRIEASQLTLESAPFNLVELAEVVGRGFVSLVQKKGVELYCCLQPDLPLFIGDRNRLQQVLNNLLSNAVKFTDSGKIVIRISGADNANGRFNVRIQISDSGIGIPKASQAKLFEPFIQADNSTARRFGGTGLGLSICRKLVELMGGKIELVSELGLGSSFTLLLELPTAGKPPSINLAGRPTVHVLAGVNEQREALLALVKYAGGQAHPLADTLPPATSNDLLLVARPYRPETTFGNKFAGVVWLDPQGASIPEWREDGWHVSSLCQQGIVQALQLADGNESDGLGRSAVFVPPALKTLHVLAVEDHPINQLVLTEQLQQLGCQVTMASDGSEALQRWQRGESFDVVLTDVNMPELDGYQLTRRLRAEGVKVPIVGVTANAQADEGERCLQAGMDGHLTKPVSLAKLREALQAVGASVAGVPKVNVIAHLNEIRPAMRDLFISTTRHDWTAMMNSLSEGNATAVTQHAHRIKGALVTIGAMDAAQFCSHLEEIAASGHLSLIDEYLGSLKEYLNPILEESS